MVPAPPGVGSVRMFCKHPLSFSPVRSRWSSVWVNEPPADAVGRRHTSSDSTRLPLSTDILLCFMLRLQSPSSRIASHFSLHCFAVVVIYRPYSMSFFMQLFLPFHSFSLVVALFPCTDGHMLLPASPPAFRRWPCCSSSFVCSICCTRCSGSEGLRHNLRRSSGPSGGHSPRLGLFDEPESESEPSALRCMLPTLLRAATTQVSPQLLLASFLLPP